MIVLPSFSEKVKTFRTSRGHVGIIGCRIGLPFESVKEFSAVLYFFGRQLHQDLKVPMGLIHSSWGGTPIAAWISGPALAANVRLAPFQTFWQNTIMQYPAAYARYEMGVKKWEDSGRQGPRPAAPLPHRRGW